MILRVPYGRPHTKEQVFLHIYDVDSKVDFAEKTLAGAPI